MGKLRKTGVVWLLLAALVILPHLCVRAGQELGSIQVVLPAEGAGAELTLYRVADINGTEYFYEPGSPFAGSGVSLSGLDTAEKVVQAAEQLAAYAAQQGITGTPQRPDGDLKVIWRDLAPGAYLVVQTGGQDQIDIQKTLVSVPSVVNGEVRYDVQVEAKYTIPEGAVILDKTDEDGNPVPGVEFLLQMKTYVTGDGALPDGMETGSDSGGRYYWQTLGTYTTDANGQIAVEHLRLGLYRFMEQSVPEGYVGTTAPFYFSIEAPGTVAVDGGRYVPGDRNVPVVSVENHRTRLEVDKINEEGTGLAGATLVICDSEGNIILDGNGNPRWQFVTDGQPHEILGIPAGSYLLRELAAPEGYHLAADVPFVVTGDTDEITVTMEDELEGAVILNKTDEDGNPVPGVEYELQRKVYAAEGEIPAGAEAGNDSSGTFYWETLGTYTTDANGQIAVEHLVVGDYRFVEQSAPEGYILSTDPLNFTISGQGTVAVENDRYVPGSGTVPELTAVNRRTRIEVDKVDINGNGVAGATLVICDSEGNIILDEAGNPRWQFVTDGQPHEVRGIPAGDYILRELEAPEGYELAADVPFTVTGDTDELITVTMVDEAEGAVILDKMNEDENPVPGVEYELQMKTYAAAGEAPDGAETGNDSTGSFYWQTLGTYTTDENGQIAVEHLKPGEYRFVEQSAPEGYILSTDPLTFSITGPGTVAVENDRYVPGIGTVPELTAVNRRTRIEVDKVDVNGNGVAGATLVICDSEGNVIVDESGNPRWQFVTDGQPHEVRGIPAGDYILRELEAPEGYALAADVPFTVIGDTDELITVTMIDEAEGAVILDKTDEDENPVPGVEYALQMKTYAADGEIPDGAETGSDSTGSFYWQTLGTYTTDANGQIAAEHLKPGDYRFVEQSAPEGYILSADPLNFSIAGPGAVSVENGQYVPGSGTVPEQTAVNRRTRVEVNKVDEEGNGVTGAVLIICDSDGNVITDENGDARWLFLTDGEPQEVRGIPAGDYLLRELTAPEGYELAADVPFTVAEGTDDLVAVTMEDRQRTEPAEGELSVTKNLTTLAGDELTGINGTFYVALFADEARTQRVSNVVPVEFSGASSQTVTFTNLPTDTVYYVSETDQFGTPLDDGTFGDGGIYAALFADGNQAELTAEVPEGAVEFENVFSELPQEYNYEGTLTVTKRVLRNGRLTNSQETFYAGIFEDPDYKTLYGDVIELKMDGSSELSVEVPVTLGKNVGDTKTYYVTETDRNGVPVAGSAGFEYEVSVDKTNVTLSGEHDEETVEITNEKTTEQEEGSLSVTKNLKTVSGENVKAADGTFYVALFADEARTRRVSDIMPMRFVNASSQTVTFEGLPLGTEYYVSETDEKGTPVDSGSIGEEGEFAAVFPDGNRKKLTVKTPDKAVTFENVFQDIPTEYYVEGELTITKRVFRNGALAGTSETFYAGIFEDPEYRTRYGDVVELAMDGNSELSVTVPVYIGQNPGDSKTYYVTETDANGTPIAGSASFTYTASVDKTSVTLSGDHSEDTVVITNARTETPGEPVIPETPDNPENPNSPENPDTPPTQNRVRTGDETPIGLYAGIFAGSAVVLLGLLVFFIRRRRKTR